MAEEPAGKYAGDVSCEAAWAGLQQVPQGDARRRAHGRGVGLRRGAVARRDRQVDRARSSGTGFPRGELVPDFIGRLKAELDKAGVGRDAPLYFICRSGNRSRHAAIAATAAGYRQCFNVEYGFEGRLGPIAIARLSGSWKAEGLPWVQS